MIEGWTQEQCQTQLMSLAATDMNKSTALGDIQTRNRFLEFRFMSKQYSQRTISWTILNVYLSDQCFTDSPGTSGIFFKPGDQSMLLRPLFDDVNSRDMSKLYFSFEHWDLKAASSRHRLGVQLVTDDRGGGKQGKAQPLAQNFLFDNLQCNECA